MLGISIKQRDRPRLTSTNLPTDILKRNGTAMGSSKQKSATQSDPRMRRTSILTGRRPFTQSTPTHSSSPRPAFRASSNVYAVSTKAVGALSSTIKHRTVAGLPVATHRGGMSWVTTLPAPMVEYEPIVTPGLRDSVRLIGISFPPNRPGGVPEEPAPARELSCTYKIVTPAPTHTPSPTTTLAPQLPAFPLTNSHRSSYLTGWPTLMMVTPGPMEQFSPITISATGGVEDGAVAIDEGGRCDADPEAVVDVDRCLDIGDCGTGIAPRIESKTRRVSIDSVKGA